MCFHVFINVFCFNFFEETHETLYSTKFNMFLRLGISIILCVQPLDTQSTSLPVVNVQASNHPNNVVKVAAYESTGNINVELSEAVRNNQVEITCITSPLDTGFTNVSFKKITIPVGRKDGSVLFDVVSAGRVVEVNCSGQSLNGGTQFQTSTSFGRHGYIQVTKPPTVSVCSDVVVVPLDPSISRTVEVLFSENVTAHPVWVNCTVLSSVKIDSLAMGLKFFARSASVMSAKIKVSYELQSEGDPVIVACRANSTSSTTASNLQYTYDTSQGDTAIFTFQVPRATFIPAAITSLGRTTTPRTVSYLVLENTTKLAEFQCSLTARDPAVNPASFCSAPGGSRGTSLELTSVTVNLITTNMTFEIGEHSKPLVIQVNGTSTQRDQRLVDITCCRKNVDPKYFILASMISLWIDVFPSVQFQWTNVSEVNTATPFSQFDRQCPCDLSVARCDIGCCCDKDCTAVETQASPCIPGSFGGESNKAVFEYGCQATYPSAENYLALLCVVTNNNPSLGLLYEFASSPAEDSVQFAALKAEARNSPFEYSESESRLLNAEDADGGATGDYRDGSLVRTNNGFLTLPQAIAGGACARYAPVAFLRNSDTWCSGEFSENMCSATSLWSARDYLVPSDAQRASCATSTQVLSFNSRDNSTQAPTDVAYSCATDASESVTIAAEQAWPSPVQERSLFESNPNSEENDPRCSFDDGVGKPAIPTFNASLDTCSNVVLKVEYRVYWRAAQIVQVHVRITLGDVRATGKTFVFQRFTVTFIHLKDVDRSQVPFIESRVVERSGNPGYVIGKKVLAKIEKNESVVLDFAAKVNQTTSGDLGLWSPLTTGLCAGAKTSRVSFGVNALSGCVVKLSLEDMANCSELRETISRNQHRLVASTHVGRRGNAALNESGDWLPLLWPSSSIPSSPIPSSNNSANQTFGVCENIPAGLHYEFLVKQAGKYQGVAQMEIVGARIRYSLHSWTFLCINLNCKSCHVNNTNDTALCTDDVQSFDVTSSVVFITIPEKEMSRQKRSADTSNTCHQDTCAAELLYPTTTSYDGEKREVAIAYCLMLFAMIITLVALTTSCLQNIRQWMAL